MRHAVTHPIECVRRQLDRPWSNDLATNRQPVRHEVVTHVLGTFCYPCVRAGQAKRGGPGRTRTCNQTVMSGRISTTFVDFLAVLFDFDGVRCTSIVSFLVRNWCGHSTSRRGRTSRCRWLRSAFSLVVVSHRRARSRSVCDLPWVWSPFPCCPSHASVRYPPTSLGLIELASRTP